MNGPSSRLAMSAEGCLLGTAVGDSIGLPYEGLSPRRAARLLGEPSRHRLFLRHGMVSDDTEHACMTASSFVESRGDPDRFASVLGARLRWWLLALPAGTGLATARAVLRLWLGVPPSRSGVDSAGNGPAMRASILGAVVADERRLPRWVAASSRITHADGRAGDGALVVALATRLARDSGTLDAAELARRLGAAGVPRDDDFRRLLAAADASVAEGEPAMEFARRHGMERGVSGFIVPTVAIALHAALSHPRDVRAAVGACIACGGDTDTTAAIAGGIVGAAVGAAGIPEAWLRTLWAAPRSVEWMRRLATEAARSGAGDPGATPPRWAWPLVPARNLAFLFLVLGHGVRRLLPPWE